MHVHFERGIIWIRHSEGSRTQKCLIINAFSLNTFSAQNSRLCVSWPVYPSRAICYHSFSPCSLMDQQYRFVCSIQNVPHSLTFPGLCMGYSPGLEWQPFPLSAFCLQVSLTDLFLLDPVLDNLCSLHSHCAIWYSGYPAVIVSLQTCLPIWTITSLSRVAVFSFLPSTWHSIYVKCTNEGIHQLWDKYVAFSLVGALDQTTEWIKESVNEELLSLSETALSPGAENGSKPSLSPTLVLNNSYLKLLQWDYQKKELPEVSDFFLPSSFPIF